MPTASWLIRFVVLFVQQSIFHGIFLCNTCLALFLLICQQLKPSGFDSAPSILYCVTLFMLRLTYLRVPRGVSSPCHLLPLGEGSAMMAYRQAYQLALVSEPHDQEGSTWKGLIRSTERWKGRRQLLHPAEQQTRVWRCLSQQT